MNYLLVENLKVKAGNYLKLLNYGEIFVFKALLEHVFNEKIAHSTVSSVNGSSNKPIGADTNTKKTGLSITEETIDIAQPSHPQVSKQQLDEPETVKIEGVRKGETEKALLIEFEGKREIWIPKSTIRSNYDARTDFKQQFTIDTWILIKNKVIAKP